MSDRTPRVLRHVAELGLRPGGQLRVLAEARDERAVHLQVDGRERVVGRELARSIYVEPTEPEADR